MIKNLCYLFLIWLTVSNIQAQKLPIDFSDNADVFTGFSGSSFTSKTDPTDSSNLVGEFMNNGTNAHQGFFIDLNNDLNLDYQKNVSLQFYFNDNINHTILFKLEKGTNADVEVSHSVSAQNSNKWQTINFDFSNAKLSGNGNNINATGQYSRITIFIDFGESKAGSFYIDDIIGDSINNSNDIDIIYNDLVWSDEFDGTTIDSNKWHHQTLVIIPNVGWANNEEQHYTNRPENSFVQDGKLHIVAKKEQYTSENITKSYTSARLNSKFAFTYGRVDVRAKMPALEGTWPAIWTLGKNINERGGFWQPQHGTVDWPVCGEIDIMEHGLYANNQINCAVHTPTTGGQIVGYKSLPNVSENFHVYSMNWSPDKLTFLIDGEVYYSYNPSNKNNTNWPFTIDQYLLLNVAMGGNSGTIDPNFTESSMIIDYVRVYQNTTASTNDFFSNRFIIYPNPSSTIINIKTDENVDKIEVFSTLGQKVLVDDNPLKVLNISHLKSGLYFIQITSNNKIAKKKIIVKK